MTKSADVVNFESYLQDDQYKTDRESLPWVQVLNKAEDLERAGFFITQENADKANFTPDEN